MQLESVKIDDNFEALKFYNSLQGDRNLGVTIERRAPFASKYTCISRDYELYRLKNEDDHILGIAALAFVNAFFSGVSKPCAIGSDLKILRNRKAVIHWPNYFVEKIRQLREERGIQHIFSAISTDEREAYNTFIRPRSTRRYLPRYYLYRRFDIVNVHGFLPGSHKILPSIRLGFCDKNNFEQLTEYIYKKSKDRPLNTFESSIDVADQIIRWPGHSAEKFIVARNHSGKIIGCMGLWSSSPLFQFHISSESEDAKFLDRLLKFCQLFGWGHSISLKVNLNPVFVTHLNFNHPDIFNSMLRYAWNSLQKNEFLSYLHFQDNLATTPPRMIIKTHLPYALYLVQLSDDPIPDIWPASTNDPAPVFEAPFI